MQSQKHHFPGFNLCKDVYSFGEIKPCWKHKFYYTKRIVISTHSGRTVHVLIWKQNFNYYSIHPSKPIFSVINFHKNTQLSNHRNKINALNSGNDQVLIISGFLVVFIQQTSITQMRQPGCLIYGHVLQPHWINGGNLNSYLS